MEPQGVGHSAQCPVRSVHAVAGVEIAFLTFYCMDGPSLASPFVPKQTLGLLSPLGCCGRCSWEHDAPMSLQDLAFRYSGDIPRSAHTGPTVTLFKSLRNHRTFSIVAAPENTTLCGQLVFFEAGCPDLNARILLLWTLSSNTEPQVPLLQPRGARVRGQNPHVLTFQASSKDRGKLPLCVPGGTDGAHLLSLAHSYVLCPTLWWARGWGRSREDKLPTFPALLFPEKSRPHTK